MVAESFVSTKPYSTVIPSIDPQTIINECVDFLNQCGSPFHAVLAAAGLLVGNSFTRIDLRSVTEDQLRSTQRGVLIHDEGAAIIGWKRPSSGKVDRVVVLGSHTDSPCFKSRPNSRIVSEGCELFGVEKYGGGLWHTWFDRGLGVAGKIFAKRPNDTDLIFDLVRIQDSVCIIPNLCIHLTSPQEREGFKPNLEDNLRPLLNIADDHDDGGNSKCRLPLGLEDRLRAELNYDAEVQILGWDLCLFDATPAKLAGSRREFIESPGLDNKASLFANFKALSMIADDVDDDNNTLWVAMGFDHEEVGSTSTSGADSDLCVKWLNLLLPSNLSPLDRAKILSNSVVISCDAAHAVHPNYAAKHQTQHKPQMGQGTVIKVNANQRYATPPTWEGILRHLAEELEVKVQSVVVRNDSPCGSTIGPMIASKTGILTIDCGAPMLAMHSARELMAAEDVVHLVKFSLLCYSLTFN